MRPGEAIPLDHDREDPCCISPDHRFHFRPGAPRRIGALMWCCCQSLCSTIEPE